MEFDFSKEPGRILNHDRQTGSGHTLVSIITPYFNDKLYFNQLFNCILNQTFPWFEWIIVDDGSTDKESIAFIEDIALKDKRIHTFRKENGGLSSARNYGLEKSTTDIIFFIDADDLVEPTFVELLYWALYYNSECSWAYMDSCGFQGQEYLWKKSFDCNLLKSCNFLVSTAAIRKKDLLEVGGFHEFKGVHYEDWELWLKFLAKGKKPVKVNSIEFWYRRKNIGQLNSIITNEASYQNAKEIIDKLARNVNTNVLAKEFVEYSFEDRFTLPRKSQFKYLYEDNNNKIKLLMLIPWMVTGGADQFNLDFIRLIDKTKYEVTIICTVASENGWKQKFREFTPQIYCLPEFLDTKNYAEFISYIISSRKIDICLISNSYYGYYLAPWLRMQFPDLALIDYVHMEEMYWRLGGYGRTSMAMSDVLEKTYVCNSATQQVFVDVFHRRREDVQTIHIGVDQNKYNPQKVSYGAVRKKFQFPIGCKIVLFPCRLHAQKRPLLMVEIAKIITQKTSDVYFLVVGDGPERFKMENKVKEYNLNQKVIFAGEQKDMLPFYRDSDLTLICSIKEGLSLTAYESCSMMTPVVSADVGGQHDLIDEKVGALIPCMQDERGLLSEDYKYEEIMLYVNAIQAILFPQDPLKYKEICVNCRKKIEDSFGLDTMIRQMERILEECNNELRVVRRHHISEVLNTVPNLVKDISALYISFESVEKDCGKAWNDRNYIEKVLNEKNEAFDNEIKELNELIDHMKYEYDMKEKECISYNILYTSIKNSLSFKVGRILTWLPRKIRGFIKCLNDHGLIYTIKYLIKKYMN